MPDVRPFRLPAVLRKCLVDGLRGRVLIANIDDSAGSASIDVDDRAVVAVSSDVTPEVPAATNGDRSEAILAMLFGVRRAEVTFDASADISSLPAIRRSIPDVILHGVRHAADMADVYEWLGETDITMEPSDDLLTVLGTAKLDPMEGYFVSQLTAGFSLRSMVENAAIGRDAAARLLCALRYSGAIVPVGSSRGWIGDADPFAPSAPVMDMAEVQQVCYLVDEKLRSIESGADYYAILEVERRAPVERIKANYRELAKTFHPDRHAVLANYAADIRDRLEAIFTALTEAYDVLSNVGDREEYDRKISVREQKSAGPTHAPEPVRASAPEPTVASAPPPKPEPRTFETRVPHKDDLAIDAGRNASGTKGQRPGGKPPMPVPIVPPLPKAPKPPPKRPSAPPLSDAHQVPVEATTPVRPPDVPRPRAPQPPVATPRIDSDALYERGSVYAVAGDYERAVQAFMRASEMAPGEARIHAALGGALAGLHGLNKAAEASLRKAVELAPNSAETFAQIAAVYQQCGRESEAKTLFKRALLLDPTNPEAIEGLGGKPANREVSDFFKQIFKK